MTTATQPFQVVGIDDADGSATVLYESSSSSACYHWHLRYISTENAGNWNHIEILDTRSECAERLWWWEREGTWIQGCGNDPEEDN